MRLWKVLLYCKHYKSFVSHYVPVVCALLREQEQLRVLLLELRVLLLQLRVLLLELLLLLLVTL